MEPRTGQPIEAMRRIRNSLSFRSALLYQAAFSLLLPTLAKAFRFTDRYRYLTFTGRTQIPLLRASMWSLAYSSSELAPLCVVCDKTISPKDVSSALKWWPGQLEIWSSHEVVEYSKQKFSPDIANFCTNHWCGQKFCASFGVPKRN